MIWSAEGNGKWVDSISILQLPGSAGPRLGQWRGERGRFSKRDKVNGVFLGFQVLFSEFGEKRRKKRKKEKKNQQTKILEPGIVCWLKNSSLCMQYSVLLNTFPLVLNIYCIHVLCWWPTWQTDPSPWWPIDPALPSWIVITVRAKGTHFNVRHPEVAAQPKRCRVINLTLMILNICFSADD